MRKLSKKLLLVNLYTLPGFALAIPNYSILPSAVTKVLVDNQTQ